MDICNLETRSFYFVFFYWEEGRGRRKWDTSVPTPLPLLATIFISSQVLQSGNPFVACQQASKFSRIASSSVIISHILFNQISHDISRLLRRTHPKIPQSRTASQSMFAFLNNPHAHTLPNDSHEPKFYDDLMTLITTGDYI